MKAVNEENYHSPFKLFISNFVQDLEAQIWVITLRMYWQGYVSYSFEPVTIFFDLIELSGQSADELVNVLLPLSLRMQLFALSL